MRMAPPSVCGKTAIPVRFSPDAVEPSRPERFVVMHARAAEEAEARLRELRREQWLDLSLAALVMGLALAATVVRPALAMPLFLGGLYVWALGIRALFRHWDLLDRLAGEGDAYVIPAVAAYAARHTMERRPTFAGGHHQGDDDDISAQLRRPAD
jgi:hypothetical protein